jgi:SAM-dependent methyltransferase
VDTSSGYEAVANQFLARRGRLPGTGIGAKAVRSWARRLPPRSSVLDLGCGPGFPITAILVEEGLEVFGVDGSAAFVAAFQRNLPGVPVLCEAVQNSRMFDRRFDAVLAWGLMFLLKVEEQYRLIRRISEILVPGGRVLFTSPARPGCWIDVMTNLESVSLGAEKYRELLGAAGLTVAEEYEDEGENHYYDAVKNYSGLGCSS